MTNELQNELSEILLAPSNEVKTDRFTESAEAAACNGICSSGACKSLV